MADTEINHPLEESSGAPATIPASNSILLDAIDYGAGSTGRVLQLSADNDGTPVAGDIFDVYAVYSTGTPPTLYDTVGHSALLGANDTDVEDPAIKTFPLRDGVTGVKIYIVNTSTVEDITPSGSIVETTH